MSNYVAPGSDVGGGAFAHPVFNPHKKSNREHAVKPTKSNGDARNPSRTPGRAKGIRPGTLARFMCKRNRSYKHASYGAVMDKLGRRTKAKG